MAGWRRSVLLLPLLTLVGAQDTEPLGPVVGIDLGTTYSCVGVWRNGDVEIIANDQGNRVTPSYVAFTDTERLVGDAAKVQAALNPANTIYDVKRLIGRRFSEEHVKKDMALWPFKVVSDAEGKPVIEVQVGGQPRRLTPQEVSAVVLGKMRDTAEAYLGTPVKNIVVTVPAYFTDAQRQATKDAGTIAGLNVLRILNEPTAAAIAYGLDRTQQPTQTVLVFDLGGGTFDVSLLIIDGGVFEVLATAGDTHLGGEDLDNRLIEHLLSIFRKKHPGKSAETNRAAMQKLRREAERAKRALSTQTQVRVELESLLPGTDFSETITRAKFEELCADLFRQTLLPVEKVLDDAALAKGDVDEVVLVGGSTRIPKVRQLLTKFFGREPNTSMNPDEAVAFGAAVQAGVLSGERDKKTAELLLLDVTPLTLGIETTGGVMGNIIPRNTVIPAQKSKTYTNSDDNQVAVTNKVYEGERPLTKDNRLLGQFELSGFPPMPKGKAQIEVTFDVDVDGILSVSAKELLSNKAAKITIKNSDRLADEDIERMVREAELHKEADRSALGRVEARRRLEEFVHNARRVLRDKDVRSRMEFDEADEIQTELRKVDEWIDANEAAPQSDFERQLLELEVETVGPLLRKYAPDDSEEAGGGGFDDLMSEEEHDEL